MTSYLLQLAAPLSLLLLILLVAQLLLVRRLGARTIYAFWLAVPIFLLIKVLLPDLPSMVQTDSIMRYQVSMQQLSEAAQKVNLLLWLWLSGVMVCVSFLLFSFITTRAQFLRATPVDAGDHTRYCRLADSNAGPHITGLLKPHILLPYDFFSRFDIRQQQLILQHELTHWYRGDLHFNYLALALLSLYWWNPLMWLAYQQYRQVQELACDAKVTEHVDKALRIAYGYALLSSNWQSPVFGWPLTHHYGDFNTMKQRIIQLQSQHGLSKTIVLAMVAVALSSTLLLQQPALAAAAKSAELAPVMRIEPRYPVQAARDGVVGFVQLKFDVTAQGKVVNVSVIKSSPNGVFDKEAQHALEQWQYNETGKLHKGNLVQLDFELDVASPDMERISVTPPVPEKA